MNMIRKGQVQDVGEDIHAQVERAQIFGVAA